MFARRYFASGSRKRLAHWSEQNKKRLLLQTSETIWGAGLLFNFIEADLGGQTSAGVWKKNSLGFLPSILHNHLRISLQCVPSMKGSV